MTTEDSYFFNTSIHLLVPSIEMTLCNNLMFSLESNNNKKYYFHLVTLLLLGSPLSFKVPGICVKSEKYYVLKRLTVFLIQVVKLIPLQLMTRQKL